MHVRTYMGWIVIMTYMYMHVCRLQECEVRSTPKLLFCLGVAFVVLLSSIMIWAQGHHTVSTH